MTRAELETVMRSQVAQIVKVAMARPLSPRDLEQRTAVLVSYAEAHAAAQRREAVAEAVRKTAR